MEPVFLILRLGSGQVLDSGLSPIDFRPEIRFGNKYGLPSAVGIHRSSIPQRQPAASDPVDDPQAGHDENRDRKRNTYESHKQKPADQTPEEAKPKRPNLPAKV